VHESLRGIITAHAVVPAPVQMSTDLSTVNHRARFVPLYLSRYRLNRPSPPLSGGRRRCGGVRCATRRGFSARFGVGEGAEAFSFINSGRPGALLNSSVASVDLVIWLPDSRAVGWRFRRCRAKRLYVYMVIRRQPASSFTTPDAQLGHTALRTGPRSSFGSGPGWLTPGRTVKTVNWKDTAAYFLLILLN